MLMWPYSRFLTMFTPVIPKAYFNIPTQEELIKWLYRNLDGLREYVDRLYSYVTDLEFATVDYVDEQIAEIRKDVAELRELIDQLGESQLVWDVQHGYYTDSADAQRDMFADLTIHSMTIAQFNDWCNANDVTVADLANCGLNCKGLAVISRSLDTANPEHSYRFAPQYYYN